MKEITSKDYKEFIKKHKEVEIENVKLTIGEPKVIKELQPKNFTLETETVWSFPEGGHGQHTT